MGRYAVRIARVESLSALAKKRARTRSRFLMTSMGVALLGVLAVGWLAQRPDLAPRVLGLRDARATDRAATISMIRGAADLSVKGTNGPMTLKAEQGSTGSVPALHEGDRFRTASDGVAELRYPTGQVIRLDADSEIELLRIGVTQAEFSTTVLRRGQVWLTSPLDQPSFEVRTTFAQVTTAKGSGSFSVAGDRATWMSADMKTRIRSLVPWDESLPLIAQKDVEIASVSVDPGERTTIARGDEQTPSKAHLGDETRSAWWRLNQELDGDYWRTLKNEKDNDAPAMTLSLSSTSPTHTTDASIVLEGDTDVLATVTIGDQHLSNDGGHFRSTIHLSIGENAVTVRSTDRAGNANEQKVAIVRDDPAAAQANAFDAVTLSGVVETGGVRLAWSESRANAFKEYIVLRSQLHAEPTVDNSSNLYVTQNRAEVGYFDGAVSEGTKYAYRICTIGTGTQSACSNVVNLTAYKVIPTVDEKPNAVIVVSAEGATIGQEISFDGSGSTDDKAVASWLWDFGDGNIVAGQKITHTYTAAGTYVVTLTVTDAADHYHKATVTIVVQ